jgi:hypothetical protein
MMTTLNVACLFNNFQIRSTSAKMSGIPDFTEYEAELAVVAGRKPTMEGVKTDPESFRIPGQFDHNGMQLGAFTPANHLEEIRKLDLVESDILLSSYPKTGILRRSA